MSYYIIFPDPTEETIRTNILINLIDGKSLEEIKQIISKLEKAEFDLTQDSFIFDGVEYGILRSR